MWRFRVRPACERRLPALPVLAYLTARSVPAFAGRSPHKCLRSMKATAGVGRFSEAIVLDRPDLNRHISLARRIQPSTAAA
ncbi:MAG: hypothetical protein EOR74_20560 [Mesorhizobium sp.]|nr:MAG: hypothetical protein EOR74_20560 [Mesorhizobium sp.]